MEGISRPTGIISLEISHRVRSMAKVSTLTKIMRKSKKADGPMIGLREIQAAQYSLIRAHPRD
jgi:hypothetical protein